MSLAQYEDKRVRVRHEDGGSTYIEGVGEAFLATEALEVLDTRRTKQKEEDEARRAELARVAAETKEAEHARMVSTIASVAAEAREKAAETLAARNGPGAKHGPSVLPSRSIKRSKFIIFLAIQYVYLFFMLIDAPLTEIDVAAAPLTEIDVAALSAPSDLEKRSI